MKLQIHKKISTYAKSILFISSIFMTITSANAELVTFKFEGVITQVGDVSTAAINRPDSFGGLVRVVDLDYLDSVDKFTGYEPGDKFTGEYIFETETPDEDSSGDVSEYNEAIRKMSFVSGKNTLTAEHGSIWQGEGEFDAIEYTVSFSPLVAGGGILESPSSTLTPRSLGMTWISDLPREDLPPLDRNPHFDTDKIVSVDGVDSFLYDPVYGSIFFSFTGLSILDIIPVRGVVHSIEVVPTCENNLVCY